MTGESEDEDTKPGRVISVVDAVCCVYFCAAGKSSLLISVLAPLGMEILIPAEVEREVVRKHLGQVQAHWPRMRASSRVKVLDPLDPHALTGAGRSGSTRRGCKPAGGCPVTVR